MPLSEQIPGNGQDLWILSLHILTIASLIGAINFLVTIWKMRTRGMSRMRMPLFVWSIEAYSALLVIVPGALGGAHAPPARPAGGDALLPPGRGR